VKAFTRKGFLHERSLPEAIIENDELRGQDKKSAKKFSSNGTLTAFTSHGDIIARHDD
jgi:hypothetical protein